ncbi:MAG: hypothetical protein ACT4OM_08090 [Actinomycetota bacterium]
MKLAVGLIAALSLVLTGCSSGEVDLEYAFNRQEGIRYLWSIDSTTEINSSTQSSIDRVVMTVDVLEQVEESSDGGDSILTVTLTPKSLSRGGTSQPTSGPLKVQYQLDPKGQIVKPITKDLETRAASALELGTILSQSRLALPGRAVGIGDTWDAPLKLDGDTGTINLSGTGKLIGFGLNGRRKLARIQTERTGDITAIEPLAGVLVELKGNTKSNAVSNLDIDNGLLFSTVSNFVSDFNLALQETGKLTGTLKVTLTSRLELQPA